MYIVKTIIKVSLLLRPTTDIHRKSNFLLIFFVQSIRPCPPFPWLQKNLYSKELLEVRVGLFVNCLDLVY